ncbi:MAG: hypothetical protein UX57_C0010G0061 [Candidatus Uhrbacteria bacterium GW2011_GWE2_46_68]|uniref:Uncharacterized protein n=2 Tax=Candidatus Uhriibacteriota TaxID=1752732 RepID=A0A0G1Q7J3_9BACT|nr:MAG: hypothetical protein UX45_C0012G0060 [Candidatus Uhrbacteria bacterium GW2011_GWF2_46_218]KKU40817.1 MAG: hypothetical protein UX57_C0010G0061 [Candidatus Uhrbacteria bacterium GW2011_GWE2_46_68]
MSFFRPTSESTPHPLGHPELDSGSSRKEDPGSKPGMTTSVLGESTLHEAIMDSVSSARDSLPKEHHKHFETLRQEIIDFTQAQGIPREALAKPDLLRKAAEKLSTPNLERLANLLERFEHLIVKKEPWTNKEALEYAEEHYRLKEQYDSQVELLEQVGILMGDAIKGIDGNTYPIPTLEQIAIRLFERREILRTKHDQGFTKLLLVPFGMSLDVLIETFKQFFLSYKESHPDLDISDSYSFAIQKRYQGADRGDTPSLVYYPKFFEENGHRGKTKMQILEGQEDNQNFFPGWTAHFFQPSNTKTLKGFATISQKDQRTLRGDENFRPPFEANKTPTEYLSILEEARGNSSSPYFQESGLTPEDWIMVFMTHFVETGKPIDASLTRDINTSYLTGAFFPSSLRTPFMDWNSSLLQVYAGSHRCDIADIGFGLRSSVII